MKSSNSLLIAIILLLAIAAPALLYPSFDGAMKVAKQTAKQNEDLSNLKQLGVALSSFARDNDGEYPESFEEFVAYMNTTGYSMDQKWFNDHQIEYFPGFKTSDNPTNTLLLIHSGKTILRYCINGSAGTDIPKKNPNPAR